MSDLLLDDLKSLIARRETVCFVGEEVSVLSVSAEQRDLATWNGLLKSGVQRCIDLRLTLPLGWCERQLAAIDSGDADELLSASQQVTAKLQDAAEGEFGRWLMESVGTLEVSDPSILVAIRDLGLPVVTANYDGLLEDVTGCRPITWKDPASIERVLSGYDPGIIHIRGHFRQPKTVVLGAPSAEGLQEDPTQALLQGMSTLKSLLLIGFGKELIYPGFMPFLERSRQTLSWSHRRHYRLVRNLDLERIGRDHASGDRVQVLGYGDSPADLVCFLNSIRAGSEAILGRQSDPLTEPSGLLGIHGRQIGPPMAIGQMSTYLETRLPAAGAREVVSIQSPLLGSCRSETEELELPVFEARIATARKLLQAGEIAAARSVAVELENEIAEKNVPARISYRIAAVLGACALGDDDRVEVRRQFEKALTLDPENPKALANRALAALLDRDLDLACELAERALASMSRDGRAMGVLLQVLYHKGDQERLEALVGSEAWMQDDLGCRAALGWIRFEQGRYSEAEKLLRAVVEAEPFNTSLRTALVGSIMGPIEADLVDAPLVGWATPADRRRRLDEAEGLQSETIRILERRQQPEQLSTAILRRSHIRLLGDRQKEALSDCERVLSDGPERPDALRLRGIIALNEPDPHLAVSCLEKASRTFGLDVTIPLAEAHLLNGNPRRAAELLSPVLHQPELGSRSLARAAEGLLLAYRRLGNAEGREEVLRALAQFAPDCPFALVIRAREAYRGGIAAESERLLRTAAERAKPHERAVIILELGAFLDHAGRHGEAADCYREVVQTPGDTPGTLRLVVALYKAGRLREARDTATKARGDGPPLVPATEIEATLRDIQGDLVGSRALWARLAEHFPKNPRYVIQTALIDMRLGKESEARAALGQVQIEAIEEDAEALVKAAQGRQALGMPDALAYCYQALRAGFDDPKTHMTYVNLFQRTRDTDFQQPTVAEEGTVVRFQVHGQEEEVLIIRPGVRARLPFEKGSDDAAVRRLLGHKRGDQVLFGGSTLNPYTVTITDIKNRYVVAYQDSMARFQFRFPDQNFVESITGDTAHTLTKVFAIVEAAQKEGGVLVSEYAQGSLPIYAISTLTGRSVYEVWRSLSLDSSAGVCASVPSPDPRSAHGVKGLVCDAVSLLTLQHLDALDVFFESCGPIFVPTQVRDEMANALQSAVPLPGEAGSLQKTGDYFALVKTPDPSRDDACVFLQAILEFIDRNCILSGSDAVLDHSQESIQEEVKWFGSGFYALLLARERGLPLLSDDQALRIVATETRVPSFWTHQWLLALAPETITMDQYRGLVVRLMRANYRYPVLTAEDFRWALAQVSFEPNAEAKQVLRYLSGDNCPPGAAVRITAYLIRSAVLASLLPLRENALVHLMLDALVKDRFSPGILRELEKALDAGLGLLPIHHDRIAKTMRAWRKAREEKKQMLVI